MCEQCQSQHERDRVFWHSVRRALLMVAAAIAKRYPERKQNDRRTA